MRQLVRGERVGVSELAAINHRWEIEIAVEAPVYIVDFCCLGLDESGEVISDEYIINFNRPDAPRGAIQLNNASNNGAVFSLALEELPPQVRRLVFTASVGENPLPGGLVGAAFSLFGLSADIGRGHIILATPAAELAWFEFSGENFGGERTLIVGELYLRDEWRFVAAGQPLRGELGAFLRTLTDGPTPAPRPMPQAQPAAPPLAAPARPPRPVSTPPVQTPLVQTTPLLPSPRRAAPTSTPPLAPPAAAPNRTVATTPPRVAPAPPSPAPQSPAPPSPAPRVSAPSNSAPRHVTSPLAPAPATIILPSTAATAAAAPVANPLAPPVAVPPIIAPIAPLNWPQSVPPGGTLQDLIDGAAPGSTLLLQRGEYAGPLVIGKPLTLEGQGSAVWLRSGPVVTLASAGVFLHDLDIEITVSSEDAGEAGVALRVETSDEPLELEGVHLRGRIAGPTVGDGVWQVPRSLDLGEMAAREINEFRFPIRVASRATLRCTVGGIEISPSQVGAGAHAITLRARDFAPDTLLVGQIEIVAPHLKFIVSLQGSAQSGVEAARGVEIGGS